MTPPARPEPQDLPPGAATEKNIEALIEARKNPALWHALVKEQIADALIARIRHEQSQVAAWRKRAEELERERDDALKFVNNPGMSWCAYCRAEIPATVDGHVDHDAAKEHLLQCKGHPIMRMVDCILSLEAWSLRWKALARRKDEQLAVVVEALEKINTGMGDETGREIPPWKIAEAALARIREIGKKVCGN